MNLYTFKFHKNLRRRTAQSTISGGIGWLGRVFDPLVRQQVKISSIHPNFGSWASTAQHHFSTPPKK